MSRLQRSDGAFERWSVTPEGAVAGGKDADTTPAMKGPRFTKGPCELRIFESQDTGRLVDDETRLGFIY